MEGAEIAAGTGLVGADLGAGAGGAVEAGGLEPDVDMQGGMSDAPLPGQIEGALGAVGAHGAGVEFGLLCILPIGFDEGVAGCLFLCLFSDTEEAKVDGLCHLRRELVDESYLGAVLLLRRRAGIGGTVGVFLNLLAVEHYIYLVAPTAVLQSVGINLGHWRVICLLCTCYMLVIP